MSARIPSRRLGQSTLAALRPHSTTYGINSTLPCRSFSCTIRLKADDAPKADPKIASPSEDPLSNPVLEEYLRRNKPGTRVESPKPIMGDLSSASIFQPENENPRYHESLSPEQRKELKKQEEELSKAADAKREHDLRALAIDPAPRKRLRLERRLVIRNAERHGRTTKAIKLARTEREYTFRSEQLLTSTKKLTRLMHLIAGKTVEEALVQLRFSPKRIAIDVRKALQIARDNAMLERGMGLGGGRNAAQAVSQAHEAEDADESQVYLADGSLRTAHKDEGKLIQLKDGSKKRVADKTEIYIDQAWVGADISTFGADHRARGRVNRLTHRTATFSVLLKEEKTRIRISEELQKKRDNRKLWVALPDRPVTTQRQYNLW
ncbi:unnamed protein product [Periconia digitata]|uniref:Mitochondrial large ribosomal subunit n=1 Tax=Periconia digitata TaxID=1303443 RepID=A0A9W4UBA2_9PLEO|nr:unnamed protein product [Periconia digitata]